MCNSGGLEEIPTYQLPRTVQELSLSRNNIGPIKSEIFSRYGNLVRLKLDGNNVSRIERFAFRGLTSLKELSIQYSSLTKLDKFCFSGLRNVTGIHLMHNRLSYIAAYTFAGMADVKLINLMYNPIVELQSNAFTGLRNVEQLALPNGIRSVQSDAFNGLDGVSVLKLAFMDLEALRAFTFRGLNRVLLLSIQESDLGTMKADVFADMTRAGSVNIINNKIDYMEEFVIEPEQMVRVVRFVGNHLLRIPKFLSAIDVRPLENFTVVGNHFFCDCRLRQLLNGALAVGTSWNFSVRNYCISPLDVKGKSIADVKLDGVCQQDGYYEQKLKSHANSTNFVYSSHLLLSLLLLFIFPWFLFITQHTE